MAFRVCLFFCLLSTFLWAERPLTQQCELPLPFCYFNNLCFDSSSSTFLGIKNYTHPEKALDLGIERGYSFKNTSKPYKTPKLLPGTTLFLFETKETKKYLGHFFHLLEHIVGLWSYYGDRNSQDVRLIVLASNGDPEKQYRWKGPNEINEHLLKALFPQAEVKTWRGLLKEYKDKTLCFERAVTSDRALSYHSAECSRLNKMLGVARHSLSQRSLHNLAAKVNAYANTQIQNSETLRVTYLKRTPPRCLSRDLEEQLLSSIQLLGNISLRVEDFATLSFKEQINIIGNTDVLISVHGNGLSHILFLPPTAKAIEIFPRGSYAVDYHLFADARGLDYMGIIADRGVLEKEEAYRLGAFGDVNIGIPTLDIAPILSKFREWQMMSK